MVDKRIKSTNLIEIMEKIHLLVWELAFTFVI